MSPPVFRFAPSPNGHLHLGHGLSALLNARAAVALSGRLLVRIEDIDRARCTPALERDLLEDLKWLGLEYETPVLRQSKSFARYRAALERLQDLGIVYPAYLTRAEIKAFVTEHEKDGRLWARDPDGAPVYPGDAAVLPAKEISRRAASEDSFALRLDMKKALDILGAPVTWREAGAEGAALFEKPQLIAADPAAWGDVVLARKDTPTSYHLSVVVDDAFQGVTDVLRGRDLYHATSVHRVLQALLGLPEPLYRHHRLVLDEEGRKLSKSDGDVSLRALRQAGMTHTGLRRRIGL